LEIWIWSGYYTSSGFRRKSHSYKVKSGVISHVVYEKYHEKQEGKEYLR
jgi:hypothetical protein